MLSLPSKTKFMFVFRYSVVYFVLFYFILFGIYLVCHVKNFYPFVSSMLKQFLFITDGLLLGRNFSGLFLQ